MPLCMNPISSVAMHELNFWWIMEGFTRFQAELLPGTNYLAISCSKNGKFSFLVYGPEQK